MSESELAKTAAQNQFEQVQAKLEEFSNIHEAGSNDNSPGTEEVVKRQEVENLDKCHEASHSQELVPDVDQQTPLVRGHEDGYEVHDDGAESKENIDILDPGEATLAAGIGELGKEKAEVPGIGNNLIPGWPKAVSIKIME